jgi:hypothetical protein
MLPSLAFRLYSSLIRCANNLAGGVSFVMLAKVLGVQKSAEAAPPPVPAAAVAQAKKAKRR